MTRVNKNKIKSNQTHIGIALCIKFNMFKNNTFFISFEVLIYKDKYLYECVNN